MRSLNEHSRQVIANVIIAIILATGLWYIVIGSAQVNAQFEMRLEYRGLPEGFIIREGMVNRITVRLQGSAELMRSLYNRDLVYTVDLSGVQRGANVLPLHVESLAEFKAFEVSGVNPARLMLEVEAISEAVLPLEVNMAPLPEDSPLRLTYVMLDPAMVTVTGPESIIKPLQNLTISHDPGMGAEEGSWALNVAVAAPEQVTVLPPVTTLRYTLSLKTEEVELWRIVQLDSADYGQYTVAPRRVALTVELPEGRVDDAAYLASIRVLVPIPATMDATSSQEMAVLVMLPEGARLTKVEPVMVTVTPRSRNAASTPEPAPLLSEETLPPEEAATSPQEEPAPFLPAGQLPLSPRPAP